MAVSYLRSTSEFLDKIQVAFNEPILASTLTSADLQVTAPDGTPVDVSSVTVTGIPGNPTAYLYTFPTPLMAFGTYQVTIGPNITDVDGNAVTEAFEGTVQIRQKSVLTIGGSDGSLSIIDPTTGNVTISGRPLDGPNGAKYTGLISQAVGDINGDNLVDVVVAATSPLGENGVTAGIAGRVFIFDGVDLANVTDGNLPAPSKSYVPFVTTNSFDAINGQRVTTGAYTNGLNVALGDVNGDGTQDVLVGTRSGILDVQRTNDTGMPTTIGKFEAGRLIVLDGATGSQIGTEQFPFSTTYTKGVVPASVDLDANGDAEIVVTRGGPVVTTGLTPARARAKAAIKIQGYNVVNGQLENLNLGANLKPTTGDGADFAWAPFDDLGPDVNPTTPVSERDGRLVGVGLPGGEQGVVFSVERDPDTNQETDFDSEIFGLLFTSTIDGQVTIESLGTNGPTAGAYRISSVANDHATAHVDVDSDGTGDLAVVLETSTPQILFLDPLTGQERSNAMYPVTPNGVTLHGY